MFSSGYVVCDPEDSSFFSAYHHILLLQLFVQNENVLILKELFVLTAILFRPLICLLCSPALTPAV